jgi:type II secretory pathway component PulF
MNRYKFKAKDKSSNLVKGEVEAVNTEQAAKLVRGKGLVVISISTSIDLFSFLKKYNDRVTSQDVASFTRQMATMISAGLPITEALLILRNQSSGNLQKIVGQILADIEEGGSLSTSMSKYSNVFEESYTSIVRSGELGGVMDEVLTKLADNLEKEQEFRGKVKGALIYPVIVIFGMIIASLIMLIFVVPRLTVLYDQFGQDLPFSTKLIMSLSDAAIKFWPLLLLGVFGLIWGFKLYKATAAGGKKVDELMFKIPLMGPLQKLVYLTEVTRTLSLMISSGVPILEALAISSQVAKNRVIADAIDDIIKLVEKGFPLAFAFAKHPEAFPLILTQMVSIGEETGKMGEVLTKVSRVFEMESDQKVKALTSAIEPAIMMVLGVGVAFLVVSIIMPIYNLTSNF